MRETPESQESQSGTISWIGQSAGKIEYPKIGYFEILRDFTLPMKIKSILCLIAWVISLGLEIALPSASAVGANSFAEGQAFTYASGGAYQPVETRRANRTQIFIKTWKVSGTIEGVGKYGQCRPLFSVN